MRRLLVVLLATLLAACGGAAGAPRPREQTSSALAAPAVAAHHGLWLSRQELLSLPTRGLPWTGLVAAASEDWGDADLADRNSTHDTSVLAGALVGVRTGDQALIDRTRRELLEVLDSDYHETLDLARNLPGYVIAADLLDLKTRSPADDAAFRALLEEARVRPLRGHVLRGSSLLRDALTSTNNWGTLARAAMVATDLYLGTHPDDLADVVRTSRAWLGEDLPNTLVWTDTPWHPDPEHKAGINPRGAVLNGRPVSGLMPEEQRRSGETLPADQGTYPWAALQGVVMAHVLLDRAGLMPFDAGDDAIVRALRWLFEINRNPPPRNGKWVPWVVNAYAGSDFPVSLDDRPGRNMAWAAWTHASRR